MRPGVTDAERIAAAIGPLRLTRARARSARSTGAHPRRTAGPGSEFWQYRTLESGEPSDKVDWRRSARSDELYVREREREDPVRLWLWVDGSASMDFASAPGVATKADIARVVTGALGLAAHEAGETCLTPPSARPLGPVQILTGLIGVSGVPQLPPLGPADVVVAAGDFLDAGSLDWAAAASASGASGVIVAVQDRAEIAFPYTGRARFEAVEAGEAAHEVGRAEAIAPTYAAAWAAHRARLADAGGRPGWFLAEIATDTPIGDHAARIAAWLGGDA